MRPCAARLPTRTHTHTRTRMHSAFLGAPPALSRLSFSGGGVSHAGGRREVWKEGLPEVPGPVAQTVGALSSTCPRSGCRRPSAAAGTPLPALSSGAAGGTDCPWGRKAPRACFSLSGDCTVQGRGREGGCLRGCVCVHVCSGTHLPLHRHQQHRALGGAAQGASHWGASGVYAAGVTGALGTVPLSE